MNRRQRKSGLAAEFLLVALPKVVGGAALILINALAISMLEPAQYGAFSVCFAGILLVEGVVGSAFDMSVLRLVPTMLTGQPDRALSIEAAALWMKAAMVAGVSLLLVPLAGPIATGVFELPEGANLVYLTCAAALAVLGLRSVQVHLQARGRFAQYGALDLLASTLRIGGMGLVWLLVDPSPAQLLAVLTVAPAVALLIGLGAWARGLLGRHRALFAAAGEVLATVSWFLLTFAVTTVAARLDLWLLTAWGSMQQVGIFSAGHVLAMIPELLGMYLAVVMSPKIMPAIKAGEFPRMLRKFQFAALSVALAMLLIAWASLGTLREFLPADYQRSATVWAILLPGALLSMVNFPLVVPTVMFIRPRALLVIELTLMMPLIILYYLGINQYGVLGAAVVTTVGRSLKAVIHAVVASRAGGSTPLDSTDSLDSSDPSRVTHS